MHTNAVHLMKCLLCSELHAAESPLEPSSICPRCLDTDDSGELLLVNEAPAYRPAVTTRVR